MEFICDSPYLVLPVSDEAEMKNIAFMSEGKIIYDLDIKIDYASPVRDVWVDMRRFYGKGIEVICTPKSDIAIDKAESIPECAYDEELRLQVLFSAKRGWLNDPNGLFYLDGVYHLFFQHNPVGTVWGNMHWGHAISRDLIHWEELDIALFPDELGTMFSGSAIVDEDNVSGLKENENAPVLLFYTAAGDTSKMSEGQKSTQCVAYSTDGGYTFKKYLYNPIIGELAPGSRDPKVIYHAPSKSYIMALFLQNNRFSLLRSQNLMDWEVSQEITLEDDAECPDFYPLALDGDPDDIYWVLTGASDRYMYGRFDGYEFVSEGYGRLHYGKNSYASQSWSGIPKDRRIRIAWNNFSKLGMAFNQSMTLPCEMTLNSSAQGPVLCTYPISETARLWQDITYMDCVRIGYGRPFIKELDSKAYDIMLQLPQARDVCLLLSIFGMETEIDFESYKVRCMGSEAPLISISGEVRLRILADANGFTIFIGDGRAFMCCGGAADYRFSKLELSSIKGEIVTGDSRIYRLESIWRSAM